MIMKILPDLSEGRLLESASDEEREAVRNRLDDENVAVARLMSPLFLLFVILLLVIDIRRIQTGVFWTSPVNLFHAASHAIYTLGALPSLAFWVESRMNRPLRWWVLWSHIFLMTAGALIMATTIYFDRRSLVLLGVAMLVTNLMYHVPRRPRRLFNMVGLTAFAVMLFTLDVGDDIALLIQVTELLALVLVAAVVGSLQNRHRIASLLAEMRLRQMAMIDTLTGVASRRRLEDVLKLELALVQRDRPVSVILLDIDHFKSVNDRFGHDTGDEVLRGVARVLQQGGRLSDVIGRWGGEEFLLVCPDTSIGSATVLAERLAGSLRQSTLPRVGRVTASFGVAEALAEDSLRDLVDRADKALYEAKNSGRDRVVSAPMPQPSNGGQRSVEAA